jgi:AcrR family transcriptional regulator
MNSSRVKQPSLRERKRERTHAHLLTVATELFGKQGFNNTSIDDIAQAAGASRATVYSYFETKDAIRKQVITRMWDDAADIYREFGQLEDWGRPSIRGWLASVLGRWIDDQPRHHVALEAAHTSQLDLNAQYTTVYVDAFMLNTPLWEARFSAVEGRRRALMLISMLEAYFFKLLNYDVETDPASVIDSMTDVWLGVLHTRF